MSVFAQFMTVVLAGLGACLGVVVSVELWARFVISPKRCGMADGSERRCVGRKSKLCMDDLCVRHCQEFHKEGCGR